LSIYAWLDIGYSLSLFWIRNDGSVRKTGTIIITFNCFPPSWVVLTRSRGSNNNN